MCIYKNIKINVIVYLHVKFVRMFNYNWLLKFVCKLLNSLEVSTESTPSIELRRR